MPVGSLRETYWCYITQQPSAPSIRLWVRGPFVLSWTSIVTFVFVIAVHCGSTRQTASIISMNKEHLRTGDKATCRFRFIKNPEYIHPNTRMVFREGRTKAIGNITKIIPHIPGTPLQTQKYKSIGVLHHHPPHHPPGHSRGKGRRGKGKYKMAASVSGSSTSVSSSGSAPSTTSELTNIQEK